LELGHVHTGIIVGVNGRDLADEFIAIETFGVCSVEFKAIRNVLEFT
jgi:hypothetical protein